MNEGLNFNEESSQNRARIGSQPTLLYYFQKIKEWYLVIRKNIFRIGALSILIGILSVLYVLFIHKPSYTASYQLFFIEETPGLSGAMRLASNFGLGGLSSGGSSSASVQEFLKSRNNIKNAMSSDYKDGQVIDLFFKFKMQKDIDFKNEFRQFFNKNQRYSDSIMTEVFIELNESAIVDRFYEDSGILNFSVTTKNENLSLELAKLLIKNAENQFRKWNQEKALASVASFQSKVDSIENLIDEKLLKLGKYQDENLSLVSSQSRMQETRLMIDLESLKLAYGEYIKGLEMTKVDMMNAEGPFKYFDEPSFPLEKRELSKVKSFVFGSILSVFFLSWISILLYEIKGQNI